MTGRPSWFQRYLLPGLAFKAVVIGGGYATGRELAEFFLPSGPWGGLMGMVLAALVWSVVCAVTFLFAQATRSEDYRTFFRNLLGPYWVGFEAAYVYFIVLVLAVIGAAAGEIGAAMLGWPAVVGSLVLVSSVAAITAFGNRGVERLFKYASVFLYGVYVLFVILMSTRFGDRIVNGFSQASAAQGWVSGGLTYASYNIIGAVVILPVVRHMLDRRDAIVSGLLAGPLCMLPAVLFFVCMVAFAADLGGEALPSDFMLRRLDLPVFHVLFQMMIFIALLETGTGAVHALNERIAHMRAERGLPFGHKARLAVSVALLVGSVFIAERIGLIALIARGYRLLAGLLLAVYILPLLTWGLWRLWTGRARRAEAT